MLAVERHAGTAINARACHFHLRTVEILRSASLEDAIRRKSQEQYPPDGGINNDGVSAGPAGLRRYGLDEPDGGV